LALAGCRPGAPPDATAPSASASTTPTATPLSLDAYRGRVATAAAVWTAAPNRPAARAAALSTTRALVGDPVAVRLRPAAAATRGAITADALAPATPTAAASATRAAGATPPPFTSPTADEPAALAARLAIVRDELDASATDQSAAREAALDTVLADAAFRDRRSLWERAAAWVTERVKRWWGDRSLPEGTGATALRLGQLIGWAVALAVIAVTGLWIARTLAGLTVDARTGAGSDALPATPSEARARAEAHAARGDYRAAVRQLYLAALLVLESNGLLRADRSRTNHEQLAAVGGGPAVAAEMAAVVDTFDRVWYGVTVPDAVTFRAYAEAIHDLERLARGAAAGGGIAATAASTSSPAADPSSEPPPADVPPPPEATP
ncbi:MAG: DUF4129 domain-containing protein, partial [Ardenticatenales bacterium]